MSFDQLGAIENSLELSNTGRVSPMIIRYVVRTGQLRARFPVVPLVQLLDAVDGACIAYEQSSKAAPLHWVNNVSQPLQVAAGDAVVDEYLDAIAAEVAVRIPTGRA
ncbi:hypothetical protein [Stenotrophomonas sp. 6O]|uniref:hypothetical protein n=1 Tax=Stenotrophomonas sp. 6O TaxID=3448170 RepID=UPI003EDFA64C